jgi:uncharacterized peroxidase-related enzyme
LQIYPSKTVKMRLHEIDRGDTLSTRLLFNFISFVSGMRLPDAARIVMYHKDFYGDPITRWTHPAMRGESKWSVGERELIAAITAKWNACTFCVGAHSAIASLVFDKVVVQAALTDYKQAPISDKLKAVLGFLEKLELRPGEVSANDVEAVLTAGVSREEIVDALAVFTLFSITVRCADTFGFALLKDKELEKSAKRLLAQGYAFGKAKTPPHPDHIACAQDLRRHVLEGPGVTYPGLRQRVAKRAAGGAAIDAPYDELAALIGEAAYRVTEDQVAKVVRQAGKEKAAFELIVAAAVGAGLHRWDAGLAALK